MTKQPASTEYPNSQPMASAIAPAPYVPTPRDYLACLVSQLRHGRGDKAGVANYSSVS